MITLVEEKTYMNKVYTYRFGVGLCHAEYTSRPDRLEWVIVSTAVPSLPILEHCDIILRHLFRICSAECR